MFYILFKEGMYHEVINGKDVIRLNDEIFPLQETVNRICQNRDRSVRKYDMNGLTLYYGHSRPKEKGTFLRYRPNRNATINSNELSVLVGNSDCNTTQTRYGEFWWQRQPVSSGRMADIQKDMTEQRENRRHYGDSPSPT